MKKATKKANLLPLKKAYDGRFDDVSAAILVVLAPEGRVVSVNAEAEELTGFEKSELENMVLADIFRDEDRQRINSIFNSTDMEFRKLFEHNVIVKKRSKRKIVVDMGFRRTVHADGKAFIFTLQDITDLKNNEERVVRAHEYVNNIIDSIIEILLVVNEQGEIQTVNDAALHLLGYREEELVGGPLGNVLPPGEDGEALAGESAAEVETKLKAKDGRLIPVLASKSDLKPNRASNGAKAVIVAMDISERKKSERLIAEQQMMIVQASKMSSLGEMASSIAHEINNPLQVILGRCELLEVLAADPSRHKELLTSVALIDKMSQRIYKIIRGLQALARDQRHDAMEEVDLGDILKDTLALCEQRMKIRVPKIDVPQFDQPVMLKCRPTQISQVLLNLMNNSYDEIAEQPSPWIKLEVKLSGGEVMISVTDSGKGLSAAVAEKIFTPFFTTKPVGKGTGIGLSVSKSLIEAHGGVLELDRNCPNTRFVIRLPSGAAASKKAS